MLRTNRTESIINQIEIIMLSFERETMTPHEAKEKVYRLQDSVFPGSSEHIVATRALYEINKTIVNLRNHHTQMCEIGLGVLVAVLSFGMVFGNILTEAFK